MNFSSASLPPPSRKFTLTAFCIDALAGYSKRKARRKGQNLDTCPVAICGQQASVEVHQQVDWRGDTARIDVYPGRV